MVSGMELANMGKHKRQIFYDLDGTIVNNKQRHYKVHNMVAKFLKIKEKSYDEWLVDHYLNKKQVTNKHWKIYAELYNKILEKPSLLRMDILIPGMKEVILKTMQDFDIYVITYRKDARLTQGQVRRLLGVKIPVIAGLPEPFSLDALRYMKKDMILDKISKSDLDGYIVGDTEFEILPGKELCLTTIAVSWGSRTVEVLEKYKPNYIISKPKEILEVIYNE